MGSLTDVIDRYLGIIYKLRSSENLDAYLKFIGVGIIARKTAAVFDPKAVLTRDGQEYTYTMSTPFKTIAFTFRINVEFDEERPDGAMVKSLIKVDGNKLIHTQIDKNGIKSTHERAFTPDSLIVVTTADGWDGTCIRTYEDLIIE